MGDEGRDRRRKRAQGSPGSPDHGGVSGEIAATLPEQIRRVYEAWEEGQTAEFVRLVQMLGHSARFGFSDVSERAAELEETIREALSDRRTMQSQEIRARLEELIVICDRAVGE